jgi:HAD superfamily hydrolase (TIGR01509 family)
MSSRTKDIRVVLFDLGGVIVELTGIPVLGSWIGNRMTYDQIYDFWFESPIVRSFETGRTRRETFADDLIAELSLPVSRDQFLAEFCTWSQQALPGALELVRRVPRNVVRATLSNTNEVHWQGLMSQPNFMDAFDRHFPSYLMGRMKPDEEAFEYVIGQLGCDPSQAVLLDDNRLNVESAARVGLNAFQVKGPIEAERALRQVGVLGDDRAKVVDELDMGGLATPFRSR